MYVFVPAITRTLCILQLILLDFDMHADVLFQGFDLVPLCMPVNRLKKHEKWYFYYF
jgi:hypothetical protein